jgi:tRNA uridine 5-carboxymethylaminomethyl modification enzyme
MSMGTEKVPIVVIGGGHAGCEAAAAAARMGVQTLLVTTDPDTIGKMSCNPAIGGVGKGHLVREIDALGGVMGRAADRAAIQYKVLNRRKGPAVWGLRAQEDRVRYAAAVREALRATPNLAIRRGTAVEVVIERGRATGVMLEEGGWVRAEAVVLAGGTFLGGRIHRGVEITPGGRIGERPVTGLTDGLVAAGLLAGRFKTGTPPRIDGETIDPTRLREEWGDDDPIPFSTYGPPSSLPRRPCWLSGTTSETHAVIRSNIDRAPLFTGQIEAVGPRSCPSVEDKVMHFPDRTTHRVFIEPEGLDTPELYLNGLATSLPPDVQEALVATVPGLEGARITQYGYAIEYDYFPPSQLFPTLEARAVRRLFLAGQLNGTTGYEEAAALGLVAGINAARAVRGEEPVVFERSRAYIGVMVDDLVTCGVESPYRIYTSRAESRLSLRNDNADLRLLPLAEALGLVSREHGARVREKEAEIRRLETALRETRWSGRRLEEALSGRGERFPRGGDTLAAVLRRPGVRIQDLLAAGLGEIAGPVREDAAREVELRVKYEGYIRRHEAEMERLRDLEAVRIPAGIDYARIRNMTAHGRERLEAVRPLTLGQASRVPGVTSNDVSVLAITLEAHRREGARGQPE